MREALEQCEHLERRADHPHVSTGPDELHGTAHLVPVHATPCRPWLELELLLLPLLPLPPLSPRTIPPTASAPRPVTHHQLRANQPGELPQYYSSSRV